MADLKKTAESLVERGFEVQTFATGAEAAAYLNSVIDGVSVGFGGSATTQELGLYESLEKHNEVHWHWINGPEERMKAIATDVYITSANGLAETGEIVNIDGTGNRLAGTLYGHKKVYFIVGRNKIAPDYDAALSRARNVAAPKNAQRLGVATPCAAKADKCYDCKSPQRICRGLTVLWEAMKSCAMEVVLIDEELGY